MKLAVPHETRLAGQAHHCPLGQIVQGGPIHGLHAGGIEALAVKKVIDSRHVGCCHMVRPSPYVEEPPGVISTAAEARAVTGRECGCFVEKEEFRCPPRSTEGFVTAAV